MPWRRSVDRQRVPFDSWAWLTHDQHMWFSTHTDVLHDGDSCAHDPNDACKGAVDEWLRHAEPYTWPHIVTFDSIDELLSVTRSLLADAPRRHKISRGMKDYFRQEGERAIGHARTALHVAIAAARSAQVAGRVHA